MNEIEVKDFIRQYCTKNHVVKVTLFDVDGKDKIYHSTIFASKSKEVFGLSKVRSDEKRYESNDWTYLAFARFLKLVNDEESYNKVIEVISDDMKKYLEVKEIPSDDFINDVIGAITQGHLPAGYHTAQRVLRTVSSTFINGLLLTSRVVK